MPNNISTEFPVFDGHNDTLLSLYKARLAGLEDRTFFTRSAHGHIDLPRAREGGFGGGFFAIYVPPDPSTVPAAGSDLHILEAGYRVEYAASLGLAYAQSYTMSVAGSLFRIEVESQGQLKVVRNAEELARCLREGVIAAVMHIEGAEAIDPELNALYLLYEAGLRSLGPVWSRANAFGYGVPFMYPHSPDTGPGLTPAGEALVRACNSLGIMIDLSHLNEAGFWQVAAISDAPLVATHTAAHSICPSTRNLTDKQLDAVRDSDGMVGVNFHVSDLRPDGHLDEDTPISVLIEHIDYMVERLGINRVGFGSDFDGATMPSEIGDVSGVPKLVEGLRAHGYDDSALRKLTHENWVRVLGQTWKG